jgi:hypothetical protein
MTDMLAANEMSRACIFYGQGHCHKGDHCPFKHDEARVQQPYGYYGINPLEWQKLFIVLVLDGSCAQRHGVIINLMDHDGFFEVVLIEMDGKVMLQTYRIRPTSLQLAEIKLSALAKVVKCNVRGDKHVVGISGHIQWLDEKDLVFTFQNDRYRETREFMFSKKHCAVVYDLT